MVWALAARWLWGAPVCRWAAVGWRSAALASQLACTDSPMASTSLQIVPPVMIVHF